MTSQAAPRGYHHGPRRGKVLGTKLKLVAPFGFQCQGKTPKGNQSPDIYAGKIDVTGFYGPSELVVSLCCFDGV
jgi:hypothetical protein